MRKTLISFLFFCITPLVFCLEKQNTNQYFIPMTCETPIYAIDDGEVVCHGYDNNLGNYIEIDYKKLGLIIKYCNLHYFRYFNDRRIEKGNQIGASGITGYVEEPGLTIIITVTNFFYQQENTDIINEINK